MLSTLRRLTILALALVSLVVNPKPVNGAAVTLFYVSAPTPTTSIHAGPTASVEESVTRIASAIGPGDSGMTRYEVQIIQSKLALHFQDTTITYISEPATQTLTMEQGASQIYVSVPPSVKSLENGRIAYVGYKSNCTIDIDENTGACREEDETPQISTDTSNFITQTSTTTYSGVLVPLATLTTSRAGKIESGLTLTISIIATLTLMSIVV
ncbi:hypothetical protein HYPSUDRAFT_202135 [Hypholoma sublateritium FD-334 SS-4]|uniref:Uncharacterized protein n=1 Tax=Hypholoma sublateritium (strain FD-334 SS-4) TaxID=945553 RepID=A0A0D2MG32_HYPSF|nr:hypothetical protein HYPSUDRAFT_202135 [Hypholoma sublateritium FD-334 SS-4]